MPRPTGEHTSHTGEAAAPGAGLAEIYDEFATTYASKRDSFDLSAILDAFSARLPPVGRLCDLGCGAGQPVCAYFLEHGWGVVGVDFSAGMLEIAARELPELTTIHADIRAADFPEESCDAVTMVYCLFHIPWREHSVIFARIRQWLRPGGELLFTYATRSYTGSDEFEGTKEFMGHELFYSHTTEERLTAQLVAANLLVVEMENHEIGGETFLWVTARRPETAI